ncbi:class F sortase [Georgenia sp. Marseille-Q6866]
MNRLLAAAAATCCSSSPGAAWTAGSPSSPGRWWEPLPARARDTGRDAHPRRPGRLPGPQPRRRPGRARPLGGGAPEVQTQSPPVRVVVPALDADLPVDAVGVAPDGQMEVPEDAARAGWYRFGPSAGAEEGATVIAAHSGSFITAYGPLRDLVELEPGDRIEVTREDGQVLEYAVESARLIPKTTIDLSEHFRRDGEHRLVLITCDGVWQDDVQSYTDNTVVTATLVP